jgi:hypothetical protein
MNLIIPLLMIIFSLQLISFILGYTIGRRHGIKMALEYCFNKYDNITIEKIKKKGCDE